MPGADSLIRTKLRQPFTRPILVSRPRLQERLLEGLRFPLTLVVAPAGSGKTTLVAATIAEACMPVAWLSLDPDDNQVGRFLTYLLAALQRVDPRIGDESAQRSAATRQVSPEIILIRLINDLEGVGQEMALVLDDYQFINNQDVHEQVAFLLEHCPKTFHLVIASRSDPPLPVSRLRARAQLVELRAADLRFTADEAAPFLNDVMGLGLDAGSVAALEERTEGWVAGLQMAALCMRDREDVPGFIEGFSGTNRFILDYLLDEVLAGQSPEIQRFLLRTSILERLCAPLCDALLGDSEEPERPNEDHLAHPDGTFASQSTRILEHLDRANLFLVSLDDERTWYRYHHLFADLLRTQLQKTLGTEGVAQLYVRASDWHGAYGSILEAISYAALASDDARVERYIEQNYLELVDRGEQAWLRFWVDKLSRDLVYSRPRLCIYEAYSHSWFGELDEADRLLDVAEQGLKSDHVASDTQALLAYVRSRVTAMRGDIDRAIAYCLAAGDRVPAGNLAFQLDTRITLGYEYFMKGDYSNAGPVLRETVRSGIAAGAVINTVASACTLARMYAVQGMLRRSHDTYQMALRAIPETGGQHLGARALVDIGLADVLCEWNDLEAALAHLEQGLAFLPMWDKADDWALAYVTLARIHLARADEAGAVEAVAQAFRSIRARGVFPEAPRAVEVAQVRLWLAQGDVQAAHHWVSSRKEHPGSGAQFGFGDDLAEIAHARVLMALGRPNEAVILLSQLAEASRSAERTGRLIEVLLLKALALWKLRNVEGALQTLAQCLALAEPEGYVRIFLDEGRATQSLLAQWLAYAGTSSLRGYATRLLSHFDAEPRRITTEQVGASPGELLTNPLTGREVEVLTLMALGQTNHEIARQLYLATGTVKAHTSSIYRKLDVANRTEAVARARQLGILP